MEWFEVSTSSPHAWQRGTSVAFMDVGLENKIKDPSFKIKNLSFKDKNSRASRTRT